MSRLPDLPQELLLLLDDYCSGLIDDDGLRRLEASLLADPDARRAFVLYFQQHTDLFFAIRSERAARAALDRVGYGGGRLIPRVGNSLIRFLRWIVRHVDVLSHRSVLVVAGMAVLGVVIILRFWAPQGGKPQEGPGPIGMPVTSVAWMINAQDCVWVSEAGMPGRDMRAGKALRLRRGLAEIEFDRGARVILRGPASLELLSGNGARLLSGVLTARVPPRARGFTLISPQGRVVDLGTEFGASVDERGNTVVHVFEGRVEAAPESAGARDGAAVTLGEEQSAEIADRTVSLRPRGAGDGAKGFVREIVPPPALVPRSLNLDFSQAVPDTLLDGAGRGIGLTHRLSGTGEALPERDENLRLDLQRGLLALTTTSSDLSGQVGLATGEYLGIRLSDLGFTGPEDFSISATFTNIPSLTEAGQFGLYAGLRSDQNIRGGLLRRRFLADNYGLFLVNNDGGDDSDLLWLGLIQTGNDVTLTLKRIAGQYSLVVENPTQKTSTTLAIRQPAFLDGERDLDVGLFGANARSDVQKTLTVKRVSVTVWSVLSEKGPTASGAD